MNYKVTNHFSKILPVAVLALVSFNSPALLWGGPMPAEFRGVIHELFSSHADFTRTVELTEDGYRAKTVAKSAEKGALLQKHVSQMESRLDDGLSVRRWDPAFAELREHYDEMEVKIEKIEGGVAVVVSGKTPAAVAVAKNHAAIITGFIEKGPAEMQAKHPAVN